MGYLNVEVAMIGLQVDRVDILLLKQKNKENIGLGPCIDC